MKVDIDIPQDKVDDATQELIVQLRKDLANALNREKKLKIKIARDESTVESAKNAIKAFKDAFETIRWDDAFEDLFRGYEY